MVSIQSSYMSPSKCKCYSPFGNIMSCSLLTFCLCSFSCLSYGDVICGTSIVCLTAYTIISTTCTNVGIANGATLPFIVFCAHTSMFFCTLLDQELEAPPSSTLFFLLRTLLRDFTTAFLLYSNVVYISSLNLFTLANGFCGFSSW
jgi:hypothetical protein